MEKRRAARAPKRRAHHLRGAPSGTAAPLTWRLLSVHAGSPRDGTGQGGCGAPARAPCALLSAARCHTAPRMLPGVSIPPRPLAHLPPAAGLLRCARWVRGLRRPGGRGAGRGAERGAERRQRPLRAAGAARSFRGGGPAPPAPPPLEGSAALPRGWGAAPGPAAVPPAGMRLPRDASRLPPAEPSPRTRSTESWDGLGLGGRLNIN